MADRLTRGMPTPEAVRNMMPAGTAGKSTARVTPLMVVQIPLSTTGGTANADLLSWINPEPTTIHISEIRVHFTTTGTGTFDIGVSADGTGSNDEMINGGTMNSAIGTAMLGGVKVNTAGTAGTIGVLQGWNLGPGGTGTNNSVVGKTSETATTAVGAAYITYFPILTA